MKVTLLAQVENWGAAGDARDVPEGAGLNHLIAEGVVRRCPPEAHARVVPAQGDTDTWREPTSIRELSSREPEKEN